MEWNPKCMEQFREFKDLRLINKTTNMSMINVIAKLIKFK